MIFLSPLPPSLPPPSLPPSLNQSIHRGGAAGAAAAVAQLQAAPLDRDRTPPAGAARLRALFLSELRANADARRPPMAAIDELRAGGAGASAVGPHVGGARAQRLHDGGARNDHVGGACLRWGATRTVVVEAVVVVVEVLLRRWVVGGAARGGEARGRRSLVYGDCYGRAGEAPQRRLRPRPRPRPRSDRGHRHRG